MMLVQVIYKTDKGQLGDPKNPRYVCIGATDAENIVSQINAIDEYGVIEYLIIDGELYIIESTSKTTTVNRMVSVNQLLKDSGIEI